MAGVRLWRYGLNEVGYNRLTFPIPTTCHLTCLCTAYVSQILGAFTMFPLLVRDGQRVPYFAVCAIFLSINLLYSESLNQRDHSEKHTSNGKESKGDFKSKVAALILPFVLLSYTGK